MDTPNQQNKLSPQPPRKQTSVYTGTEKSLVVAFLLTFFFGPLGLFYASVKNGIWMTLIFFGKCGTDSAFRVQFIFGNNSSLYLDDLHCERIQRCQGNHKRYGPENKDQKP